MERGIMCHERVGGRDGEGCVCVWGGGGELEKEGI